MSEECAVEAKIARFLQDAPLFLQDWWLQAVAADRWAYITVMRGEEIAGVMPLVRKQRLGFIAWEAPPHTPFTGPWLRASLAKNANRLAEEKELLEELIGKIPCNIHFLQRFHPGITNWLPFYWAGYSQTTYYTYRFEDTSDLQLLWSELRENIRTDIRKGRKVLQVVESEDFLEVLALHKLTWRRQGKVLPFPEEEMVRIHAACVAQNCCKILKASDAEGRTHAAAYFIWDAKQVYYYTSGAHPELRKSGAGSLLIWSGIELANRLGKGFDFEGSMVEPIERVFRSFGAKQTPYFQITKTTRPVLTFMIRQLGMVKWRLRSVLGSWFLVLGCLLGVFGCYGK